MSAPAGARSPMAVLFDVLGTLLRLEPPGPRLRRELAARGVDVDAAAADAAMRAEIAYYLEHHLEGGDAAGLGDLRRRCAAVLHEALGEAGRAASPQDIHDALLGALRFAAYPDAALALARLRAAGLRLVAVSNWDVSLHERLAQTGIAALLDGAIASAELGVTKPDAAIFAHALRIAGAPPDRAVHVGDSPVADVGGARAAGIEPVLLVREGDAPRGERVRTIRSLAELADLAGPAAP